MKKKFLARLTGLVMAFAVAATNVAFADDDVFVSEDETFISEDESVVDEGGSSESETEGNTEEDNDDDSGMGRGGIADEDAGIDAYAPDIEGDDLFSGMFAEEEVAGLDQSQSLPSSYNGFERGNLPKVRNQGSYGCCWSFAAVGSAEADLIHDGKADKNIDLSELQVAYFTSHNFTASKKGMDKDTYHFNPSKEIRYYLNNGGNGAFAAGALMNGIGFVGESDLPYTLAGSTTNEEGSIADRYAQSVNSAMLTGAYCASSNDRDTIKRLIMEHGGVNTLIHAPGDEKSARGECFFSEEYNSYITTYREVDHVIMLVGWDDDFSRDKFPDHKPDKDGAWLVRNSWGYNGYGCKGYFWLSYEDSSLADTNAYAYDADTKVYDNCYSYAKAGTRCQFYNYWNSRDRIVTVQNYHIDQGEKILAAGLEFTSPNVTCEIVVKGKKGGHTAGKLFKTNLPGYYTVQLECPFEVTDPSGEDVEVTVSYRGNDLRVPIEGPGDYKVVNISVTTQTESDGVTINGEHSKDRDSKVRLFTDNTSSKSGRTKEDVVSTRDKTVKIDKSTGSVQGLDSECGYSKMPEKLKENYSLKWSVENTDVAVIDGDNTGEEVSVKAVGAGSTYLICECLYGGEVIDYSECELTVDPYGISYDLGSLKPGEDVFSAYELPDWFFPGNEGQCILEDVARTGYDFDGWYEDEDLTKPVTEELLAENKDGYYSKDLTLHPKWKKKQLTLSYQALRSDLSGYDDNTIEIAKLTVDDFTGEGNTYVLPDAAELTGIGEVYGWALDGYGDEAVSSLGMDRAFDLDLVYEDQYYNSHYEQNDTLVLYPQYGNWQIVPPFRWNDDPYADDDKLVTASFEIDSASGEKLALVSDVPADGIEITELIDPTWSKKGSITYNAFWKRGGSGFGSNKVYEISPIKDSYTGPKWNWIEDTDAAHGYRVVAAWTKKDKDMPDSGDEWEKGDEEKLSSRFEKEAVISSVVRSENKIVMTAAVTMDDGTKIESAPYSVDAKNKPASTRSEQKEIDAGEFTAVQNDVLDLYDDSNMALVYFKGKTTNAEPYSISLTKGGDFYSVVYDGDDISGMTNGYAVIGIKLNEDINTEKLIKEAAKNNKLEFSVKGINSTNAVTCPLTLKTVYKAPKIKLAASSATFYEGFVTDDTLKSIVYETSGLIKEGYDQSGWEAEYCRKRGGSYSVVENSSVDVDAGSHSLTISVPKGNYKNGFIRLHGGDWADDAYVYARYDIKLARAAALELTDKRITLNANNAGANEKVKVSVSSKGGGALPQSVLSTLAVEGTDRLFTGLTVDAGNLDKDGSIVVTLGSKPGRNGNCKLYITGELPGGKKQRLALTVNVSDKAADKAVRFSAKGSIDALYGGRIFAKPTISGYPGSIVSAVIEPHDGIAMYDAMVDDTGMIVITPGKDFVYNKKGSTETVKLTLDTGAVLSGTLKIKPATGKLSAGGEDRTVKIDPATGGGSAEVPVMAVYSYKYQTSADSYVTKIKMYDIDDFTRLDVAAKQQKGLIVGAVADKGILRINTTADARPGKTVTVPVTVTEESTGSKASFKIKVSLTE